MTVQGTTGSAGAAKAKPAPVPPKAKPSPPLPPAVPAGYGTKPEPAVGSQPAGPGPIIGPRPAPDPPDSDPAPQPPDDSTTAPDAPTGLSSVPLTGSDAVEEMYNQARLHDIDPLAAAANALGEGAGGGIGDSGTAFGPWQMHLLDGRVPAFAGQPRFSPAVQAWAWSQAGIREAFLEMRAGGAAGLTGHDAVHAIVYGFERPADEAGAYSTRVKTYDSLLGKGLDVFAYLGDHFNGPAAAAAPTGDSGPFVGPDQVTVTRPAGVQAAWEDLIGFYSSTIPQRHAAVGSFADSLVNVFK